MKRVWCVLPALLLLAQTAVSQDVVREISHVKGDVYRFQNRFHVSVFTITGAGVVVSDPINADAVKWLKPEIAKLTAQPVTTLIYSHSHLDHASGGGAWGALDTVVAHENAPADIDGVAPTRRFSDQLTLTVGDKTFELTYLGPGHGKDLIATVIRPENVAFVVDAVSVRRLFYRDFGNANVDDWIKQVRTIEGLDFDVFVGGHGPVGTRSDVSAGLEYLTTLRAEVLSGLRAGLSVDALAEEVLMEDYSEWGAYDRWRELNVRGMARFLSLTGAQ